MLIQLRLAVSSTDIDTYGHVNNITYIQYLEKARIKFLGELELSDPELKDKYGLGFLVTKLEARYVSQLTYPHTFTLSSNFRRAGIKLIANHRITIPELVFESIQEFAFCSLNGQVTMKSRSSIRQLLALFDEANLEKRV